MRRPLFSNATELCVGNDGRRKQPLPAHPPPLRFLLSNAGMDAPVSCWDRGKGGVDAGAWCLSLLATRVARVVVRPKNHIRTKDRHQAPTLPHHPPPVPTDGVQHVERFPDSVVNIYPIGHFQKQRLTPAPSIWCRGESRKLHRSSQDASWVLWSVLRDQIVS